MVRHALGAEDKQARRGAILEAASALFAAGDGGLPAAAQIASAAGLAKGTVYLYFQTKEEIFVALLLANLRALLDAIEVTFDAAAGRDADAVAAFLAMYVGYFGQHTELLRLDAIGYGVLERNMDPAKLRAFKLDSVAMLTRTGAAVERALRLPAGRGVTLLLRTFALTRGLWQSSHPGGAPAAEPVLAPLYPDFLDELADALGEYWRGALATAL